MYRISLPQPVWVGLLAVGLTWCVESLLPSRAAAQQGSSAGAGPGHVEANATGGDSDDTRAADSPKKRASGATQGATPIASVSVAESRSRAPLGAAQVVKRAGAESTGSDAGPQTSAEPSIEVDGGTPVSASEPRAASPAVQALAQRAAAIRALLEGSLEVGVEPQSLFEVSLRDEGAVRVEIERLRAVIARADLGAAGRAVGEGCPHAGEECADARKTVAGGATPRGVSVRKTGALPPGREPTRASEAKPAASAEVEAAPVSGVTDADASVAPELGPLDPELWNAQLELDRARLAFLEKSKDERQTLLDAHAKRQREIAEVDKKRALTAAEQAAREAALERDRALEAARLARSEASRLVAEERARLLGTIKRQAEFEADLARKELGLRAAKEATLKLLREVREVREAKRPLDGASGAVDGLYLRLRARLREARRELAAATSRFAGTRSGVPAPGESRLVELPVDVDTTALVALRKRAELATQRLTDAERRYLASRAAQLYHEVESLNAERLSLLPELSEAERQAIRGFGGAGLEQALSEVRQVAVVLRYHLVMTLNWAGALADTKSARGRAALDAALLALRALPPLMLFLWWRRRAERTLLELRKALRATRDVGISPVSDESALTQVLSLIERIRNPGEWLLLVLAVTWVLPSSIADLPEYALPYTVLVWTLGGTLAVLAIDHWASGRTTTKRRAARIAAAGLRLRSLRLVGRVVVAVGLLLALTAQLVGEGTIYGWMLRLCWFAAVPVGLVLVLWWRPLIFDRVEAKRRQTGLERWIIAHRSGWQSFIAATLGGAELAADGMHRRLRVWVGSFTVTRRVLAYLFRREITKKADSAARVELAPLGTDEYVALGPSARSRTLVPSVADAQLAAVTARVKAPGGGVFAIVGERGLGKSTVLHRLASECPSALVLECPFGGMESFAPKFLEMLGAAPDARLEQVVENFASSARPDASILIDDAHRLVRPVMGGLRGFDRVLDVARKSSGNLAWVFAFDDVIWRFFERIRGAQPIFDDVVRLTPWPEEAIARLLTARSDSAGLLPAFDRAVSGLPPDADEADLQEAHERAEANYYRLIWDHARGNPGVALHVWRSLLGVDERGRHAVRVFRAADSQSLERLPDSAVFVMRAVIQMERADASAIVSATGIPQTEVEDALRFGVARGYFGLDEHGYGLEWEWFRVITRFLQRRHLLFAE